METSNALAYIKGVGDDFAPMTHFDTLIREGKYYLKNGDFYCGEFGMGVADRLGINSSDENYTSSILLCTQKRT